MAGSMVLALRQVQEHPDFDRRFRLAVDPPARAPTDPDVTLAFRRHDYRAGFEGITIGLMRSWRCDRGWIEEAVQDALAHLFETKRELFTQHPDSWMKLLYRVAHQQLIKNRRNEHRTGSIDGMWWEDGDEAFKGARPAVAATVEGVDEEAKYLPPPHPGEEWERMQMVGAAQRFRDRNGRPPTQEECKRHWRELSLPPATAIAREFESYNDYLLEAGMTPRFTARTRKWSAFETAWECASFKRRHGYWPGRAEIDDTSNCLPPRGACDRFLGGRRSIDVQLGVELILTPDEIRGRR
jgi:DNA-directed RNA polymerase specialized sigma24 family protein